MLMVAQIPIYMSAESLQQLKWEAAFFLIRQEPWNVGFLDEKHLNSGDLMWIPQEHAVFTFSLDFYSSLGFPESKTEARGSEFLSMSEPTNQPEKDSEV